MNTGTQCSTKPMHPKERPVPVLDPLGQPVPQCPSAPVPQCPSAPVPQCPSAPVPQCPSAPATRYNAMGLNVYFDKFQKKNKFQRFDSVSLHLDGEGFFEKFFSPPSALLGEL